ncbi:MAG TPA: substrate-binding domain-containing protein, partial [Blastocatellia bacterium]|nr:substrate-binding domain-containing protein [Blastocatellia bacterium]
MRLLSRWALIILAAVAVSSCGRARPQDRPELTVAAAADLEGAFREIAAKFESENGAHVILSFAASGNLKQQIENGAPFDVFA